MNRSERARKKYGLDDPLEGLDFGGDDFVGEFLEDLDLRGRRPWTKKEYARILRKFEEYLGEADGTHIGKTTERQVLRWKRRLEGRGLSKRTINTYLTKLSKFFKFLVDGWMYPHTHNPVERVKDEMDNPGGRSSRREISIGEMSEFVRSVRNPRDRAIVVTFLKTGMRKTELRNLKIEHVSVGNDLQGKHLSVWESSVFVDSSLPGNKRRMDTTIPLDDEAVRAMKTWLAVRPEDGGDNLFLSFDKSEKLGSSSVNRIIEKYAKKRGWHRKGAGVQNNVTPHYFRHFFTTKMRLRGMPDIFVDYLRGDTPKTAKDTYTHLSWGDIRRTYEEYIYKFGI